MFDVIFQLPIKSHSERVAGKNFRLLGGVPLYHHMLKTLREAQKILASGGASSQVRIYTDSVKSDFWETLPEDLKTDDGILAGDVTVYLRPAWLSGNKANGNHLLYTMAANVEEQPKVYAQAFATAPFLKPESVVRAVKWLLRDWLDYLSTFTATAETGFWWFQGKPVNYTPGQPAGMPRTQDAPLVRETTGLYAVASKALLAHGARTVEPALPIKVTPREALDIDTEEDFRRAEHELSLLR